MTAAVPARTTMRVMVTLNSLILGGSQLNAVDLALAGRAHGVDPVLVGFASTLPASGPSMLDAARERGAELHVLDAATDTVDAAPALARLADAHGVDLVHGYGGWDLRSAFLGPCRWGRRPLVQTVYEMYVPPATYRHQPLVVGTGYLLDEQRDRPGSVDLVSPPVDLTVDTPTHDGTGLVRELGLDPSHVRVVVVSRLASEMKELGIRHTIEAVGRLARADVDLLVVGTGDAEERLRAVGAAVNARLGRTAVTFTGAMHDPRAAYAAADVVVGMGSSAARALAFGRPLVVCGEHGWYRTFTEETASLLLRNSFWSDHEEPHPVARLTDHLRRLVDDAGLRRHLGAHGRAVAQQHFGLELMAERLAAIYARTLAHHGRAGWFRDLAVEARPGAAWLQRRWAGWRRTALAG